MPRGELLDDHVVALQLRSVERLDDLLSRGQIRRNATSLVAVARLDDHGHANRLGGRPCVFRIGNRSSIGNRHAHRGKQHASQFLVLGNLLGNGAGAIGFGRLDASLTRAVAELDQIACIQTPHRDTASKGRVDNRVGAGAQANLMGHIPQLLDFAFDVERTIINRRQHQLAGRHQASASHHLLFVFDHHTIDALFRRLAGTAESDLDSSQCMQLQADMFENMPRIGAVSQSLKKSTSLADAASVLDHARQPCHEPVVETGKIGGWTIQVAEIHPNFKHRIVRPDVRTT